MPGLPTDVKRDDISDHYPRNHGTHSFELPYCAILGSSIDQLYRNVCEMESSSPSPSHASFLSYGDTSKIDSELCHLAGDIGDLEVTSTDKAFKTRKATGDASPAKELNLKSTKQGKTTSANRIPRDNMKSKASTKLTSRTKSNDNTILKQSNAEDRKHKSKFANRGKFMKKESNPLEYDLENPNVGPFLIRRLINMIGSGEKSEQILDLATKAADSLKPLCKGSPSLDTVLSMHLLAAIYCNLGNYEEGIAALESTTEIPYRGKGENQARAEFSACMQIGEIYSWLGKLEDCIRWYKAGLEIQRKALGDGDPRFGETCRLIAEVHLQALQLDDAEKYCQIALTVHQNKNGAASIDEAADRRLMGIICEAKGDYEDALEHFILASKLVPTNGQASEIASLECSIGDAYLALGRYNEAATVYEKALRLLKSNKGDNSMAIASVYVRLANLCSTTGKLKDCKSYCNNALEVYENHSGNLEVANGLTEICAIYEKMRDMDGSVSVLEKAKEICRKGEGIERIVGGIETEMGVLYYMMGKYEESYEMFEAAIGKLRRSGERKSVLLGIALNQMGLTCVHRYAIHEAAEAFEEAKCIMEEHYGPHHPDTLSVCSNLAGTYDALGRLDEAIHMLEHVVAFRDDQFGSANPVVEDEKRRLYQLTLDARRNPKRLPYTLLPHA